MLIKTFRQVEVGTPVSCSPLHLFPLEGVIAPVEETVTLLHEALEDEILRVEELSESGSVSEVRVMNGGDTPVLIFEGDELIGAKQNRVVNSSVLIGAASELILPVSCAERGRWSSRPTPITRTEGSPHLVLRCAWRVEISEKLAADRFVFVDEMGSNTSLSPLYGWSKVGERLRAPRPRRIGARTSRCFRA